MRWFWHVDISRIPFRVLKLALSKVFWCMKLMLGVYLFSEVFIANPPWFNVCVKIHTVVIEAGSIDWICVGQNLKTKSYKYCLRVNTRYRSLFTSATFCQCLQLQRVINFAIMPLSWAYGCPVKGTLIEPGLQNCNRWLNNSIRYSTSCETDNRTPSTGL